MIDDNERKIQDELTLKPRISQKLNFKFDKPVVSRLYEYNRFDADIIKEELTIGKFKLK